MFKATLRFAAYLTTARTDAKIRTHITNWNGIKKSHGKIPLTNLTAVRHRPIVTDKMMIRNAHKLTKNNDLRFHPKPDDVVCTIFPKCHPCIPGRRVARIGCRGSQKVSAGIS